MLVVSCTSSKYIVLSTLVRSEALIDVYSSEGFNEMAFFVFAAPSANFGMQYLLMEQLIYGQENRVSEGAFPHIRNRTEGGKTR